jgi:hypothetical protein
MSALQVVSYIARKKEDENTGERCEACDDGENIDGRDGAAHIFESPPCVNMLTAALYF